MKSLTYKIVKTIEASERPKVIFDREHYLNELKKEIGLSEFSYDEIGAGDFKVQLNSPTGRSCSFEIKAKDYIDNELKHIEEAINEENSKEEDDVTFDIITVQIDESQEKAFRAMIEKSEDFWEWAEEHAPIKEVKMEQPTSNFKYFDVKIGDNVYTVVLFDNGTLEYKDQYNRVRKHFATVKERSRDFLTGLEFIVNYYQWANLVSGLDNPKGGDYLSYEDISSRMSTIFQGVEGLEDIAAKF
jgi:hypothetical protein